MFAASSADSDRSPFCNSMCVLGWRPGGVAALSPDFGKVTFNPSAFGRLQFLTAEPTNAAELKN